MKDYYSILQISKTASSTEIKSAYRSLSKKYHPDVSKAPNATIIFIEIKEAYEVLIDDYRRKNYNQLLDFYLNKVRQNIDVIPRISFFYSDKATFTLGEIVTFTWEVQDADIVELRPFGRIPSSGTKKIKITEASSNLLVELFSYNSISKNYVFSQMILKQTKHENINSEKQFTQEDYQNVYSNYADSELDRLIRTYPEIDRRNLEKEIWFSLFGRIGRITYLQRIILLTAIYFIFICYFISSQSLDSLQSLLVNSFYYTLLYILAVKRFHDFNSRGSLAFLSAIPLVSLFQCFYLIKKEGDTEINKYGLPNEVLLKNNSTTIKNSIKKKYQKLSKLEKFSLGTICFNIFMVILFFLIPKYETTSEVLNQFTRQVYSNKSYETHYFIETINDDYEVSEKMNKIISLMESKLVYLGINPLTKNVNFIRVRQGDYEMTHYISVINYNSSISIVYLIFLMFQYYVFFIDKTIKNDKFYSSILYFFSIINIAYFFFFII